MAELEKLDGISSLRELTVYGNPVSVIFLIYQLIYFKYNL